MSKFVDVEPIIQYAQEQVTGIFAYPQGTKKEDEQAERKAWRVVRDYLVNTQDADVQEVKHSRWVENENGYEFCEACLHPRLLNGAEEPVYSPYCPNCGAKMDK